MTKAFTKGQEVTYISNYDRKGTFCYQQAIVYSCGKKRMVLTDAATGKEMGRNYVPELGSLEAGVITTASGAKQFRMVGGTFPRMTDEQAEAACLEVAASWLANEREYLEGLKRTAWAHAPEVMDKAIAELHEPRAVRR